MAIQIVRRLERQERRHANHHGTEMLIPNVEVVVHEPAALLRQDAVVRVLGGKLGDSGAECRSLFHALEDEVDAVAIVLLHFLQIREDEVLFPDSLFGPLHGNALLARERFHPPPVLGSSLPQRLFGDCPNRQNFPEEVHHLPWPGEMLQVSVDHDPIETVVYKYQQAAKQLCERFHRLLRIVQSRQPNNRLKADGIKISNIFG
jgi:hypothetical protein